MCQKCTSSVKSWSSLASTNILSPLCSNVSSKNAGCVVVRLFTADVFFKRIPVWLQNLLELVWHRILFHADSYRCETRYSNRCCWNCACFLWRVIPPRKFLSLSKIPLKDTLFPTAFHESKLFLYSSCKEYHIPRSRLNPYFFTICSATFLFFGYS